MKLILLISGSQYGAGIAPQSPPVKTWLLSGPISATATVREALEAQVKGETVICVPDFETIEVMRL